MKTSLRWVLACSLGLLAAPGYGETVYVSDELTVQLRTGPSNAYRILAGLSSGTELEVLGKDDAGYTQVRTQRGTEGWIESQYLIPDPIAKTRLIASQREVTALKRQLDSQTKRVEELTAIGRQQADSNAGNQTQIGQLEEQLAEIKRISSGAIEAFEENEALRETNLRLRDEIDDLAEERNLLQGNGRNQAIMIGAGLVLLGLLIGVIIKARPQRSAWS